MASSSNSAMMSTIDALKDQMSDAVYLELCNKMKELHNQENDPMSIEVKAYCIWFFEAKGWTVSTREHKYDLFAKKHIVMMTRSRALEIQRLIEQQDRHCCEFSFNSPTMSRFYDDPMVGKYEKLNGLSVMVYRIEPM